MRGRQLLFCDGDIDGELRSRQSQVSQTVDNAPKDKFLISGDKEFAGNVVTRLEVEPLAPLAYEAVSMGPTETRVNVSDDSGRYYRTAQPGLFYVCVTPVDVESPFTGEEWLSDSIRALKDHMTGSRMRGNLPSRVESCCK